MKRERTSREPTYRLMLRAAQLYYGLVPGLKPMKYKEIGERLGLSRTRVGALLQSARNENIVSTEVRLNVPRAYQMEQELVEKYGLQDALVTMTGETSPEGVLEILGNEAASYFRRIVTDGARIGISGGRTVRAMVRALTRPPEFRNLQIYPLATAGSQEIVSVSANTLVGIMCIKYEDLNVKGNSLQVPSFGLEPIEEAIRMKEQLLSRKDVRGIFQGAQQCDFVFLGIGRLDPGLTLGEIARFLNVDVNALRKAGAVGDILYQALNADGSIMDCELNQRIIAIPAKRLQEMVKEPGKRVIAIAGGRDKIPVLKAAMKGAYFDTLVTDEDTAGGLLT